MAPSLSRWSAVALSNWRNADDRDRRWLVIAVCGFALVFGYLLKSQCIGVNWLLGEQYKKLCYNDIQPLYGGREIDDKIFPYVEAEFVDGEFRNGAIEYPVLTGVFMWASGLPVSTMESYLRISAFLLAPFAILIAILLEKMRGLRALLWAGAPALVLYAFHNWDLLVVAAAVVGLWLAERKRPEWAAVVFGVGAAFKMYPLLFVAPLAILYLRRDGLMRAAKVAAAGLGTFLLINLPFMLASPGGWLITYEFHSERGPNFDTIWYMGFDLFSWQPWSSGTLNLVTTGLTALAMVAALAIGWNRTRGEDDYPFLQVAGAMLAAFMLFNKVHSPQYTLWLLPFFVILPVRRLWWVAYSIVDLAIYFGIFRWFYDWTLTRDFEEVTFAKSLVMGGVWVRALLLAGLFFAFLRSRPEVPELSGAQKMSQARPSLTPEEQPAS